eukprot:Amastigsp_a511886_79.p2 type:complete len:385 gc:universal Amastigsp_a511886_79:1791-637(-)
MRDRQIHRGNRDGGVPRANHRHAVRDQERERNNDGFVARLGEWDHELAVCVRGGLHRFTRNDRRPDLDVRLELHAQELALRVAEVDLHKVKQLAFRSDDCGDQTLLNGRHEDFNVRVLGHAHVELVRRRQELVREHEPRGRFRGERRGELVDVDLGEPYACPRNLVELDVCLGADSDPPFLARNVHAAQGGNRKVARGSGELDLGAYSHRERLLHRVREAHAEHGARLLALAQRREVCGRARRVGVGHRDHLPRPNLRARVRDVEHAKRRRHTHLENLAPRRHETEREPCVEGQHAFADLAHEALRNSHHRVVFNNLQLGQLGRRKRRRIELGGHGRRLFAASAPGARVVDLPLKRDRARRRQHANDLSGGRGAVRRRRKRAFA